MQIHMTVSKEVLLLNCNLKMMAKQLYTDQLDLVAFEPTTSNIWSTPGAETSGHTHSIKQTRTKHFNVSVKELDS